MNARRIIPSIFLSAILSLGGAALRAQSDTTTVARSPGDQFGLVAGYHGFAYHHVEIGLVRGASRNFNVAGFGLSGDLRIGGEMVAGAVARAWTGGREGNYSLGLALGYYSDFKGATTLRLQPGLEIVGGGFRLGYSYSIVIAGPGFDGINRHDFSFRFVLPFQ